MRNRKRELMPEDRCPAPFHRIESIKLGIDAMIVSNCVVMLFRDSITICEIPVYMNGYQREKDSVFNKREEI
jgi:hypothetical protein